MFADCGDRLWSAAVAIPVFMLSLRSIETKLVLFIAVCLRCGFEYYRAMLPRRQHRFVYMHTVLSPVIPLAAFHSGIIGFMLGSTVVLGFVLCLVLLQHMRGTKKSLQKADFASLCIQLFGHIYIGQSMGYIILLHEAFCIAGSVALFFIVAVTMLGDAGAHVVGNLFGKTPIMGTVSPNKSLEGCIGSVLFSIASVCGILSALSSTSHAFTNVWDPSVAFQVTIGCIIAVAGMAGDALESFMKRCNKVKDMGDFLPGWGGLLDRLDGLLLSGPTLYISLVLLQVIPTVPSACHASQVDVASWLTPLFG